MAIRRSRPLVWKPKGLSDAVDGTNSFAGAMTQLVNLVPSTATKNQFVPRPAATLINDFSTSGIVSPGQISAMLQIGNILYGMIAAGSGTFAGKDVPFSYNVLSNTFAVIGGITVANLPNTQPTTGDWTPPTMDVIAGRVVVTHPGFAGTGNMIGWFDITGFGSGQGITGDTHSTTTVDALSANVLQAGWNIGDLITSADGDIPNGARIVTIAAGGLSLTISIAATGSNAAQIISAEGGTIASPLWSAGTTNGFPLLGVPLAVKNFNGSAFYAVPGAGMQISDSGNATQITNASQALTPLNGLDVTAFGALPVTQTTGGILQALIAFQGDAQMQMVTGSFALTTLSMNAFGEGVGCLAPNTITSTPKGLAFVAPDGLRFIDLTGAVTNPIGAYGEGVLVPFLNAQNPTRMCAAFNQNVLRISVQNGFVNEQPLQEYWLDFSLGIFTGPHTFPAALIEAYQAPSGAGNGHGFIMAPAGIVGQLWDSAVNPNAFSLYTENNIALTYAFQTVLLPDNEQMMMNAIIQSTIGLALPNNETVAISMSDELGNLLASVMLSGPAVSATTWGAFIWGAAPWGSSTPAYYEHPINWPNPIVFKQGSFLLTGSSTAGFVAGNLSLQYQILDYLTQRSA